MLCVLCYQSACLCDTDDVWLPLVVITISLFHNSVHPWTSVFCCTAIVDPTEKKNRKVFLSVIILDRLSWIWDLRVSYCTSLLLLFICSLIIWDNRPFNGPMKGNMVELGKPAPMGVYHICSRARLTSWLVPTHFNLVLYKSQYASTWSLFWWWKGNVTARISSACKTVWTSLMQNLCLLLIWFF